MTQVSDPKVQAIFQPNPDKPPRALLVAGACGNVGFGKLGQFARLLSKHGVPVVALDLSPAVNEVGARLRKAFSRKFNDEQIDGILAHLQIVHGTLDDVPKELEIGFVFEAIPERLDIKRPFYEAIRARDPEAYVFSATSGLTSHKLFDGLPGADRSGVMHPFFPHLTNKLWEIPTRGCVTSKETLKAIRKLLGGFGMNVIEVADVPSFAADRVFCGMMLEAVRIHADTGLSPAQVDDVCKKELGASPFFVHNLIAGANYLSAHCMELMQEEVDSTLYAIPDAWQPYIEDPKKQWPYERGERCPPERHAEVRERMLGMLFAITAYEIEHDIANPSVLNFLCENALAFRLGTPALIEDLGFDEAKRITASFLEKQKITHADEVAPLGALSAERNGFGNIYVDTAVHGDVGLLSLKRTTLNHVFIAELDAAYEKLNSDDAVKAIVLAPDGSFSREFGHGADGNCFVPVLGKFDDALGLIQTWKKTLTKLRKGKPTVAALVGRVLGGGLEFASNCHARIAAEGTRLGQPEPNVGVLPGLGGCHHIHRFSNDGAHARINEILLTGHTFKVEEAVEWGFVSKTVPVAKLPQESMALAASLAANPDSIPSFRDGALEIQVSRDVNTKSEAGVALDADLRELIAKTIEEANNLPYAEGSALEERRAAESLTMSTSKIGVKAMLRGKPPTFENPLS
jgi:enoyl-CoA hydratase/carnithine racemase